MPSMTIENAIQIALGHHQAGRLAEAEAIYRQVLALDPEHADALHLLGTLACQAGRWDLAIELIGRAIAIDPLVARYHHNLGEAYRRSGQCDRAIASFRYALGLRPDDAETVNSLGVALYETGRMDEAINAHRWVLERQGDHAWAHVNLANALSTQGRLDEASAACRRAIALKPDFAEAYNSLGAILHARHQDEEAADAYCRAIELAPGYGEAHNNLGNVFKDQGRIARALDSYRRAVASRPGFSQAESNLLLSLHYHPDHDGQSILEEHRRWARQYAGPLAAQILPHPNDRSPDRRLRIGYVSPDLRAHAVGRLLLPLLVCHDRKEVEIVCYSDARVPDALTAELKAQAGEWRDTAGLSDPLLARRVRDDRIDILVDLAQHTAGNRLLVFARKPAPVQVTMLGLPSTTGLETIDYRLTDPFLDPPGAIDRDHTERSIRLPHCSMVFEPPGEAPPVGALPAAANGFVTFGCLNQLAKLTRPALELWVEILQSVPGSRLVLQSHPGPHLDEIRALFEQGGIAGERVEFVARAALAEYLHRYRNLDLCLDPFPYSGHTGTFDALWMGVPVITLAGRTGVGRGGVSILSNLGLLELIARTPAEYAAVAIDWARDLTRLATLRAGLRQRMSASPLMNARRFAADVEAAFRGMWTSWCASDQASW
jgi:predicted O-linked N-acetylglucosamine transferase (SPINDLY family)